MTMMSNPSTNGTSTTNPSSTVSTPRVDTKQNQNNHHAITPLNLSANPHNSIPNSNSKLLTPSSSSISSGSTSTKPITVSAHHNLHALRQQSTPSPVRLLFYLYLFNLIYMKV